MLPVFATGVRYAPQCRLIDSFSFFKSPSRTANTAKVNFTFKDLKKLGAFPKKDFLIADLSL